MRSILPDKIERAAAVEALVAVVAGRKPSNRGEALTRAMQLFWERGFEGTSFDELIAVMGISPSSFYNSFGRKERLYQEATETYLAVSDVWFPRELSGRWITASPC